MNMEAKINLANQTREALWSGGGLFDQLSWERSAQDVKWGEQNHNNGTGHTLDKIYADAARSRCDSAAEHGRVTWRLILDEEVKEAFAESDPMKLRTELVQVAAVCLSWIEAIDRNSK